jgi:hypothetical protein
MNPQVCCIPASKAFQSSDKNHACLLTPKQLCIEEPVVNPFFEVNVYSIKEKTWLSTMTPTSTYFLGFVFFYLLNYKTYRLQTLQVTVVLQLDCGKNNS